MPSLKKHSLKKHSLTKYNTVCLLALLCALQLGCTSPAPMAYQLATDKVGVVVVDQQPEMRLSGFGPRSRTEGAVAGAAEALIMEPRLIALAGMAASNPVALVLLACVMVPTAIVGAVLSPSSDDVKKAEQQWGKQLPYTAVLQHFRDAVADAALVNGANWAPVALENVQPSAQKNRYTKLADTGISHVLELAITRIGAEGKDLDAPFALHMYATAKILSTRDGTELQRTDVEYWGESKQRAAWAEKNGRVLWQAMLNGADAMGKHVYENMFMLYPYPDQSWHSDFPRGSVGLAPLDPGAGGMFEFDKVTSNKPTLRWQAFPRNSDISRASSDMQRIKNVRYDLLIAQVRSYDLMYLAERHGRDLKIIVHREGLPAPEYTLEKPLPSGRHFVWSVRARFELDGRERVTEWSGLGAPPAGALTPALVPPGGFYYLFQTP